MDVGIESEIFDRLASLNRRVSEIERKLNRLSDKYSADNAIIGVNTHNSL